MGSKLPRTDAGLVSDHATPLLGPRRIDRSHYPKLHPESDAYDHGFDLRAAAREFQNVPTKESGIVKTKAFPCYLRSTWERVRVAHSVPKMAGIAALIDYGLDELNRHPVAIAHRELRDSICAAPTIALRDQTRLDGALNKVRWFPPSEYGGVEYYSFRCTEEFRDQLASAAAFFGVHSSMLAIVCICIGLSAVNDVNDEATTAMRATYKEFIDTIRFVTESISGSFAAACVRSEKQRGQRQSFTVDTEDFQ